MENNNRFLVIWNADRTTALVVDTSHTEYIKLNVNSGNSDQTLDPKAPYVKELQYPEVEALFTNFIEQQFWGPDALNVAFSSIYGDAIRDVDELLQGEKKNPFDNVELQAIETPQETPQVNHQETHQEDKPPASLGRFKGSINIIASGSSSINIGDEGIKSIINKVDNN